MVCRRIPKKYQSFRLVWEAEIYSRTSYRGGTTGEELITADTIDISEWTNFGYYNLCQYWYKKELEENPRIGRRLGVSHRVGSALYYYILTAKGQVIARKAVHHVTKEEAATDYFQGIIGHYNKCLADNFGQGNHYASDLDGLEGFTNDDAPNP